MPAPQKQFLSINAGHVITIITILFTIGVCWGTMLNRMDTFQKGQDRGVQRMDMLTQTVAEMHTDVQILLRVQPGAKTVSNPFEHNEP